MGAHDALIGTLLRGEAPGVGVAGAIDAEAFVHVAALHRVLPLLDRRLVSMPAAFPPEVAAACHEAYVDNTVSEVLQRAELLRVLDAFAAAGLEPLLLKGGALAYAYYPDPALRFREDADLLVRESEVERAGAVLRSLGYARRMGPATALQSSWNFRDARGMYHHVDLHWRVNNSQLLGRVLAYDELRPRAVVVAALGPNALGLSPVDALLLACIHRAGHLMDAHFREDPAHPGGDRLIWFYDMRLIAAGFDRASWEAFLGAAEAKRIRAVCLDALSIARREVGAAIPDEVLLRLAAPGPAEPSAALLDGLPTTRLLAEMRATQGFSGRIAFLRALAFPSPAHLRQKYAAAAIRWLPWLYARRGLEGLWKLLVPRRLD